MFEDTDPFLQERLEYEREQWDAATRDNEPDPDHYE